MPPAEPVETSNPRVYEAVDFPRRETCQLLYPLGYVSNEPIIPARGISATSKPARYRTPPPSSTPTRPRKLGIKDINDPVEPAPGWGDKPGVCRCYGAMVPPHLSRIGPLELINSPVLLPMSVRYPCADDACAPRWGGLAGYGTCRATVITCPPCMRFPWQLHLPALLPSGL